MTLTLHIPPELEKRLEAEAAKLGVTTAEYVRVMLERIYASPSPAPLWMTATKEEWLKAFNTWMDSHDPGLPPLSEEATAPQSLLHLPPRTVL